MRQPAGGQRVVGSAIPDTTRATAVPAPIAQFLKQPTPPAWVVAAGRQVAVLLNDHSNCEKKAASSALAMMFRYPERPGLSTAMSKLAREELRHFEQVQSLMCRVGVCYRPVRPSRYAQRLRDACRSTEPGRLIDTLIVGALIEARSCERFALLLPVLSDAIADLYRRLLRSEARHFEVYLGLARSVGGADIMARVEVLAALESTLATAADENFAFHSGPPGTTSTPA